VLLRETRILVLLTFLYAVIARHFKQCDEPHSKPHQPGDKKRLRYEMSVNTTHNAAPNSDVEEKRKLLDTFIVFGASDRQSHAVIF
jgi:hypothetical protein